VELLMACHSARSSAVIIASTAAIGSLASEADAPAGDGAMPLDRSRSGGAGEGGAVAGADTGDAGAAGDA